MKTVCAGDSISCLRRWSFYWPQRQIVNAGVIGEDTAAILARIPGLLAAHPDAAAFHIQAGTNDLTNAWPAAVVNIEAMADLCIAAGMPFILCQVPPRRWIMNGLNYGIVDLCARRGWASPIDYYTPMQALGGECNESLFVDGTHPNPAGYDVMARALSARYPTLFPAYTSIAQAAVLTE